jgi:hypothetical protein
MIFRCLSQVSVVQKPHRLIEKECWALSSEPQTKDTKWRHGSAYFEPVRFPAAYANAGGLVPVKAVINIEVGEEVVLYLRISNPLLARLAKIKELQLRLNCGVARNEFGPLGFLLFWVPFRNSPQNALTIFDLYVNIANEALMSMWRELAYQTHWHVFLLDEHDMQRNFWEFTNTFRLDQALNEIVAFCGALPVIDFDRAKEKFIAESSLEALHALTSRSEINSEGKSIFDASNMVPTPPALPHPLKAARFSGVIRESLARSKGSASEAGFAYEREKRSELEALLASKTLVYLDVCHWINLRHVWLQSAKALPVYERIVGRLNALAEAQAVICLLSAPIFEELMKQSDPLSRTATANLMEIFSRGICVRGFKEALCEQWRIYSCAESKPTVKLAASITKVGYWLPEGVLKTLFLNPDTQNTWERVLVDLRWNLTVDDFQRLVGLGEASKAAEPPFLTKWRSLPTEQKLKKKSLPDLLKGCRKDVLDAYSKELFGAEGLDGAHLSADSIIQATDYGRLPCCEVVAGMCAAQVYRGGRVRENDVFDFIHAAAGIPHCRAYFCDGPMEHLLRKKPLELDAHIDIVIRSRPEDLLIYLESIQSP